MTTLATESLQPVYTSCKLEDALISVKEQKLSDQSTQCDLQIFMSSVWCRIHTVGLKAQRLFQRNEEHCCSSSSICRHLQQDHDTSPRSLDLAKNFAVLSAKERWTVWYTRRSWLKSTDHVLTSKYQTQYVIKYSLNFGIFFVRSLDDSLAKNNKLLFLA